MTIDTKNDPVDTSDETDVEGSGDEVDTTDYKALHAKTEKALLKEKALRKQLSDEVSKAKKGIGEDGTNYKQLYEQADAKAAKVVERAKKADINSAATAQLTKIGVTADGMGAALKLLDTNAVEWDEDDGVDPTSVKAAVQSLRNEYPFLFEKKVTSTTVKVAKDGSASGNDNEISRADFDKLSPKDKAARISKGVKVTD